VLISSIGIPVDAVAIVAGEGVAIAPDVVVEEITISGVVEVVVDSAVIVVVGGGGGEVVVVEARVVAVVVGEPPIELSEVPDPAAGPKV